MTDPIGTAQERELIEWLRDRAFHTEKESDERDLNAAADALQSRIAEVGRLTETLEFVRDWLANSRDVGADGWVPLDHINAALSLHRRPT